MASPRAWPTNEPMRRSVAWFAGRSGTGVDGGAMVGFPFVADVTFWRGLLALAAAYPLWRPARLVATAACCPNTCQRGASTPKGTHARRPGGRSSSSDRVPAEYVGRRQRHGREPHAAAESPRFAGNSSLYHGVEQGVPMASPARQTTPADQGQPPGLKTAERAATLVPVRPPYSATRARKPRPWAKPCW